MFTAHFFANFSKQNWMLIQAHTAMPQNTVLMSPKNTAKCTVKLYKSDSRI